MKKHWLILSIFLLAFLIRFLSVWPANTIIGFDQARDLFDSLKIIQGDLRIIGPTAGNNPNLHHGVAWLYFIIPPLFISRHPISVVIWNSLFNALVVVIIYLLTKSLTSSLLASCSYYLVSYAGWLSNPTATIWTVSLFFLGIWKYHEGKTWGLPLAMFFLGLSIQFELFFIYLIPVFIILWFILKLKLPTLKIFVLSLVACCLSLSTMIATEIKFHFAGVKSLLAAGSFVGGSQRFDLWKLFPLDLLPQANNLDLFFGLVVIGYLIYKKKYFLLVWFFSPALMLLLGSHNAPWFLVGRPVAAIAAAGFAFSQSKPKLLGVLATLLICLANLTAIKNAYGAGQPLLEPDPGAILSKQIAVMDYTYQKSQSEPFAIDTVTNPLYINAVWAWNFGWYSQKYDFKPTWLGGDQLSPYNTLLKATGKEKFLFLIIDETFRIPDVYRQNARQSILKKGVFVEKRDFGGLLVEMYRTKS